MNTPELKIEIINYTKDDFMQILSDECEAADENDTIEDVIKRSNQILNHYTPAAKAEANHNGKMANELVSFTFPYVAFGPNSPTGV